MADIRYPNSFGKAGGFNITNNEPVDSRMYVNDISHIYLSENWDKVKPYPGLIVSDPNGNVRICINSDYTKENSWVKINSEDIEGINNTINGIINTVSANTSSINALEETLKNVSDNDTKNTAGSSESTDKLYLIGAKEQVESGTTTYSNSKIYVSDGALYVDGDNVLVSNDITGLTENISELEEIVSGQTENIETIKNTLTSHTSTLNAHGTSIENNTNTITGLTDTVSGINNVVISHTVTLNEYHNLITGNTQEIENIKEEMPPTLSFGSGLGVSANTVNIQIAESDNYLKVSDNKLVVSGINTDDTFVSEDITIAGGPLADLAKQAYTGGTVPQGTSIQEFFRNLLCNEVYPTTSKNTPSYSISISTPTITANVNSGSLQEIGTKVNFNAVTAKIVSESKTEPKVSGFKYGYSDTINGTIIGGPTSVTTTISSSQKSGEVYKLTGTKSGFSGTVPSSASNATYSSCKLSATTLTVALGTNSYTVSETGPKYTYSYSGIGAKYVVSNLGNRSEDEKSEAVAAKSATDSNQPTTSTTFTVTGVYPVYTNISNGVLTVDASTKMNLQTSATFTFENVPGEVGSNPFMFDFPSGKSVSSFQMKNPSGEWVSFSADYTTDTTVTKTINGTSYTYKRLKTDGTQGAGNTYKIVLNTALNA